MNDRGCEPFIADCHVRAAVELISHTWDPVVISALRLGPTRRAVLLGRIAGVSDKVLSESLRRLYRRGLIAQAASGSGRGAAVYELTDLGASLAQGPVAHLAQWAAEHQAELAEP